MTSLHFPRRFELITLGDELLLGLTTNSHLAFIGAQLGRHGAMLARNVTVTDEAAAIERQFRESWASADVIITTGGLGPTCDDRTREVIAGVLGQTLVFDPSIETSIAERFGRLGRPMTKNNLKQAYRFANGSVLPNANGTAPGLWFEQDGKVLCMLPGPPNELQPMFVTQVLPRLAALGCIRDHEAYVQLRTAGIGESSLEDRLQPVFNRFGDALTVAFCAHQGHVDCRLSSSGDRFSGTQLLEIATECACLLGEDFVCYGNEPLARICANLLRERELTIAVAEAATGGLLANAFTELHGACKFFAGGCVCYSNESRMQLLDVPEEILSQHGAVSPEGAVAMATGAAERLGADYALAVTGFASPTCGHEASPIGTIYIALYSPNGVWSRKLSYPGPRETVKVRAVNAALDWLRRDLHKTRTSSKALIATAPTSSG